MNRISIGLLSYKRTDLLLETIKDIIQTSYNLDLIILNNNEDVDILRDIELLLLRNTSIKLKYLWFKENLGVSTGRREILSACTTELIVMLDDDLHIESIDNILSSVLSEFGSEDKLGGIAFNIIDIKTGYPNHYEIPHKNKKIDMSNRFYTYLMIGAGHAFRTKVAVDVGGYADDFGLYGCEELDLAFRILNSGYKILYSPNCIVHHKKSPDGRFSSIQVNYQAFVNRTKIAKRHFRLLYFISCFSVRSIYFLYKTRSLTAYIKAVKDILSDKKKDKFKSYFYQYIKNVNGFIYY